MSTSPSRTVRLLASDRHHLFEGHSPAKHKAEIDGDEVLGAQMVTRAFDQLHPPLFAELKGILLPKHEPVSRSFDHRVGPASHRTAIARDRVGPREGPREEIPGRLTVVNFAKTATSLLEGRRPPAGDQFEQ
jgi:hypothetical protein